MPTSAFYEVLDNQQRPQQGKEKPSKEMIKLPPPLTPSQPLCGQGVKNLLTWVRFKRISFPDFDEQVYTSTGYLRQDRQETEICAHTSMVTDKRKEKKKRGLIFCEETEEEKRRK